MTEGASWKHIIRFALPLLLGMLLQQLYNTTDTVIVGNFVGTEALSAVGTTINISFLFLAISIGLSTGTCVLVSHAFGAKNQEEMRLHASTGILFILLLGLAVSVLSIVISRPAFVYWLGVPQEILPLTLLYFRIFSVGLVFQFGYNIISSILRAVGDSAASLYFLLAASVLNIGLDLFFVINLKAGVAGAAAATVIAQFLCFVIAYLYMSKKYPVFRFKLSDYHWNGRSIKETCRVGIPVYLQLGIMSLGLSFIQRAASSFGTEMTAAFTVLQRVEMYVMIPYICFQNALATFTGQNLGAGLPQRVFKAGFQTVLMTFLITASIALAICLNAEAITGSFALEGEAFYYGYRCLRITIIINILLSLYNPLFGVFQGNKKSEIATVIAIFVLCVRIGATYFFKDRNIFGKSIIWWNPLFGFSIGFIITWIMFLSRMWLDKDKRK